jgi:hypothetical protein
LNSPRILFMLRYCLACFGWSNREFLFLNSTTANYKLIDPITNPIFDASMQHEAVRVNDTLPVSVKCVPTGVPEQVRALRHEIRHLRALARESWVPRSIESFSTQNGLNCLVKEAIERTLFSARISSEDAMRLGARMLNITETLHKKFQLNNRHALASSWGYTKDGRRFVIANPGDLVSTSDFDAHGYHRVRELHSLGRVMDVLEEGQWAKNSS